MASKLLPMKEPRKTDVAALIVRLLHVLEADGIKVAQDGADIAITLPTGRAFRVSVSIPTGRPPGNTPPTRG